MKKYVYNPAIEGASGENETFICGVPSGNYFLVFNDVDSIVIVFEKGSDEESVKKIVIAETSFVPGDCVCAKVNDSRYILYQDDKKFNVVGLYSATDWRKK
jgi:hypothetical protein